MKLFVSIVLATSIAVANCLPFLHSDIEESENMSDKILQIIQLVCPDSDIMVLDHRETGDTLSKNHIELSVTLLYKSVQEIQNTYCPSKISDSADEWTSTSEKSFTTESFPSLSEIPEMVDSTQVNNGTVTASVTEVVAVPNEVTAVNEVTAANEVTANVTSNVITMPLQSSPFESIEQIFSECNLNKWLGQLKKYLTNKIQYVLRCLERL